MESLISRLVFHQWQRKLVALLTATIVWLFVSHSITAVKTIPSVPIRVINLPPDKTISGLRPNGFLVKRISLTLSGSKDVIQQMEPGDIEVILDVSNLPNEGLIQIAKKNLISLNPAVNLSKHITSVTHPEFLLKMSPLVTEKVPVIIHPPTGLPPSGYDFLDAWPLELTQIVTGPEEQVFELKNHGLDITFNLNDLTKEQLDELQTGTTYNDEVTFVIPDQWKKVSIPFLMSGPVAINDPEAQFLQLNFLRKQFIPIKNELPIHIFYPLNNVSTINPETFPLAANNFVLMKNHIPVLKVPLLAANVSKLFLEIVKDNIEIQVVAVPKTERERLQWGIGFIDESHLEDAYAAYLLSSIKGHSSESQAYAVDSEMHFRLRFRKYLQELQLYLSSQYKLEIESSLEENQIQIHVPNASLQSKTK